jgi:hypothetical protein
MSVAAPAGRRRGVAVTAVGLAALLFGLAYAALAVWFLFEGFGLVSSGVRNVPEPDAEAAGALSAWRVMLIFEYSLPSLLVGGLLTLSGVGVLLRLRWSAVWRSSWPSRPPQPSWFGWTRGVIALLVGVPLGLTFTAAQAIYGLLALIVLVNNGEEFARPRPAEAGRASSHPRVAKPPGLSTRRRIRSCPCGVDPLSRPLKGRKSQPLL